MYRLAQFPDERGCVSHIFKKSEHSLMEFENVAEVYMSTCYPGKMKGWHYHTQMNMLYTCISGVAQVVYTFDKKEFNTFFIGEGNYCNVSIPKHTWNAFRAVGPKPAIIINITDMEHDRKEILRSPDSEFKYEWDMHI